MTLTQLIKRETPSEMNEILDRINSGEVEYFDLHDNTTKKLQGYIVFDNDSVCPLFTDVAYFCLNPLFVSKSKNTLQLSRFSVGGTVSPYIYECDMKKAIAWFNAIASENEYSSHRLITDYKIF